MVLIGSKSFVKTGKFAIFSQRRPSSARTDFPLSWSPFMIILVCLFAFVVMLLTSETGIVSGEINSISIDGDDEFTSTNGVVSGNGTKGDPYIIEGWGIWMYRSYGVKVMDTTKYFVVRNITILSSSSNYYYAVQLIRCTGGGRIENVTHNGATNIGIEIFSSRNFTIRDIYPDPWPWVAVSGSKNIRLEGLQVKKSFRVSYSSGCVIVGCNNSYQSPFIWGISVYNCSGTTLRNCNFSDAKVGVFMTESVDSIIDNCIMTNNSLHDLEVQGRNIKVTNCTLGPRGVIASRSLNIDTTNTVNGKPLRYFDKASNKQIGPDTGQIILHRCSHFTVSNLTLDGVVNGLYMTQITESVFRDLTLNSTTLDVYVLGGHNLTFVGIKASTRYIIKNVRNVTIIENIFPGITHDGNEISQEHWVTIEGSYISNGQSIGVETKNGAWLHIAINNTTVRGFDDACLKFDTFRSLKVTNTTLSNTFWGNDVGTGLWYLGTGTVEIRGNWFNNHYYGIERAAHTSGIIDDNFFTDCKIAAIAFEYSFTRVSNNTITFCKTGVMVNGSRAVVENNLVENCEVGISVSGFTNVVRDNTIRGCDLFGIRYEVAFGTDSKGVITDNRIESCQVGINLWSRSHKTVVKRCTISDCGIGILLDGPDECRVFDNTIETCSNYGVSITRGTGNVVIRNNLIQTNYDIFSGQYNGPQASVNTTGNWFYENKVGNFWADYRIRYPSAQLSDNGRYWETPYVLAGTQAGLDIYPLAIKVDINPPVAEAGEDQTVDQGTTVRLDARGSKDDIRVYSWIWSFMYNSTEVTLRNQISIFTFHIPGVYTVQLIVKDEWGNSDDDTVTIVVQDTEPPELDMDTEVFADMGETFTLKAKAKDNAGGVTYRWSIDPHGLNLTYQGDTVQLTIEDPGYYPSELIVTDAVGNEVTAQFLIIIRDIIPPSAVAGDDVEVDQDTSVLFDGTGCSDNYGIREWNWSFYYQGELVNLRGETRTFIFVTPGVYNVLLTVIDDFDLISQDFMVVTVRDTEAPVAVTAGRIEVPQGTEVVLDGLNSTDNGVIDRYEWSFEYNGSTIELEGVQVPYVFWTVGEYEVYLRVVDTDGNTGDTILIIVVKDVTLPVLVVNVPDRVDMGTEVHLDGSGSWDNIGIAEAIWSFEYDEDEQTLYVLSAHFTFEIPGTYMLTLTVWDLSQNKDVLEVTLDVLDNVPPVCVVGEDMYIVVGTRVCLDGSQCCDNIGIASYRWTITSGDRVTEREGVEVHYSFHEIGVYSVTLSILDHWDNAANGSLIVTVNSIQVRRSIGPFIDGKGDPIKGVKVRIDANGTNYDGKTDAEGLLEVTIKWRDLEGPLQVTAKKDGWQNLEFEIGLDEERKADGDIPVMKKEEDTSAVGVAFVLLALAIPVALGILRRRTD